MTLHRCPAGPGSRVSHRGWQGDARSGGRCQGSAGRGRGSGAVPARAGSCAYVPRACPLNPARERRGAGERQRSRAERCQRGRDGLGGSLRSLHAARPALRSRRLQNHPLRLHPAGDRLRDLGVDPRRGYLRLLAAAAGMGDVRVPHLLPHLPAAPLKLPPRLPQEQRELESAGQFVPWHHSHSVHERRCPAGQRHHQL